VNEIVVFCDSLLAPLSAPEFPTYVIPAVPVTSKAPAKADDDTEQYLMQSILLF
jgi:hypothetical protein